MPKTSLDAKAIAAAWGDSNGQSKVEIVENKKPDTVIAMPEDMVRLVVAAAQNEAWNGGQEEGFQMGVAAEQGKKPRTVSEAVSGVVTRTVKQPFIDAIASIGTGAEAADWPTPAEWQTAPSFLSTAPKEKSATRQTLERIGGRLVGLARAAVEQELVTRGVITRKKEGEE